jgi:hypothetical protein
MRHTKKPALVVFGEDWGRHPSSTQHLIAALAHEWDVLWMNSVGMRRPRLSLKDTRRIVEKLGHWRKPAPKTPAPEGVMVRAPLAVPWPGFGLPMLVNRELLGRQVRGLMRARGVSAPVLWISVPTALSVVGALDERAVAYYCGDDFGALEGVDHAPVAAMEQKLVERADVVFAASEVLARRFPGCKTIYLPHGVDMTLFSTPAPRPHDLPTGLCAGFYGAFDDRIDDEMLAAAARALPHWTFVFIGPAVRQQSALSGLPNVRFLGPRPHHALPGYVQHWTASMIPFKNTAMVYASNPLKLREYLAAGAPVATTPFPAMEPYRALLHVGANAEGFTAALEAAARDQGRTAGRRAAVAGESWEQRAKLAHAALLRTLPSSG